VAWNGDQFVEVEGSAAGVVDTIKARELMQRVSGQGFGMFCARYSVGPSDGAGMVITLSIAGKSKRVQDIGGAAPALLRTMADDIDRVGDTHKWRHGEPAEETFGDDRLVVDLVSPKAGVTRLMRVAGAPNTSELADMVADTSLNLNVVDSSGWTALMYAAQAGSPEAVAILLKARAKAELKSLEGETAMFAAVSSTQHPDAKVRMLAAAGVDVNGQDDLGVTPLMLAARHSRMPGLIAALMTLGADPTKRDDEGRTALDYLNEAEASGGVRDSVTRGLLGGR
jgi:ankyrin repeat protein